MLEVRDSDDRIAFVSAAIDDDFREMTDNVVVLNPVSGTADHADDVHALAGERGLDVRETEGEGDAVDFARAAAEDGATFVAAAGGDGTLNEVVRGIEAAGALEDVEVGVVPCGTGNDFAGNIGITSIEQAFEVFDHGERRRIDVGFADGHPFLNSCVSGLTAEASAETDPDLKSQFGVVAYILTTIRTVPSFEGFEVTVDLYGDSDDDGDETPVWSGSAAAILVGNGRRFPPGGSTQANMEDGKFDVTLVNDANSLDLMTKAAAEALLERDTPQTNRYEAPALTVHVEEGDPIAFSLDGEIIHSERLSLRTRPAALSIPVGPTYEPEPED